MTFPATGNNVKMDRNLKRKLRDREKRNTTKRVSKGERKNVKTQHKDKWISKQKSDVAKKIMTKNFNEKHQCEKTVSSQGTKHNLIIYLIIYESRRNYWLVL